MEQLLSFVIPCYRSEHTIRKVVGEIAETAAERPQFAYEIILVNDCSPDQVYEEMKLLAEKDQRIKVVNLAKNMGKHAAVLAGYAYVKGRYIVNLDDDFQSPVCELWKLLEPVVNDSCDYATASYYKKQQSAFKNFGSNINLRMSEVLLEKPKGLRFENFSVMKRFVCDEIVNYKNPYPYLEGLVLRVTQRVVAVPMEQRPRGDAMGTGFTFRKSFALLLNGLTAFSIKPLRFATLAGFLFSAAGFLWGVYTIVHKLQNPAVPMGYSSLAAILLFSSGLVMLMLGMIGEYLGRIYICINDSPQYVVRDTINL